jgi:hypothetical protein
MPFIEFHDWGSRTFDLFHLFPNRFYPLIDRHMTKPQDPTNGPKPQAFQVQGQRHAEMSRSRPIGFMSHNEKVLTRFALVALSSFVDPTFDLSVLAHRGQSASSPPSESTSSGAGAPAANFLRNMA